MRGLGNVLKGTVFIAGLLGVSAAAFAQQDPRVPVTFRQFVPADTYNETTKIYAGGQVSQSRIATKAEENFLSQVTYKFSIANTTTNDLNRVFFRATFSAIGTDETVTVARALPSISGAGIACDTSVPGVVECQLGTFTPTGTSSADVYVVVNVPYSGQQIQAVWIGGGYEGNGNGNGCCQPTGTYITALSETATDKQYTYKLQTFLNKDGAKLFTGDSYTPSKADRGTTYVAVPTIPDYTIGDLDKYLATIDETLYEPTRTGIDNCSVNKRFNWCFKTQLSIEKANLALYSQDESFLPDKLLKMTLRLDTSAMKPSTKIDNVMVSYFDELTSETKLVSSCVSNADGTISKANLPCWTRRFQWGPSEPGYTPDLNKDFQWDLLNYKNGVLEFF